MNYLAHLFLSDRTPESDLGSLCPDFLPSPAIKRLGPAVLSAAERHYQVDRFTDSHPVVAQSCGLFRHVFGRYSGILVDVFYDHFLAAHWDSFESCRPLNEFASETYSRLRGVLSHCPPPMRDTLCRMAAEDWLTSYREISGVRSALDRISARARRPVELSTASEIFISNYDVLEGQFLSFLPELIAHINAPVGAQERNPTSA